MPDSEDSSEFESFTSDNEADNAEAAGSARDEDRENSPSRSEDTCITQRVLAQLRESEVVPHKLLTTGMLLVDFNQELPLSIH